MIKTFCTTLAFTCLFLSISASAQNEFPGQLVQQSSQLNYWNVRTFDKSGYFELFDPIEDDARIGFWSADGTNAPSQKIVTVDGILGYAIPANQPYAIGIVLTEALYDTSPGESFDNFGKFFEEGLVLPTSINPATWNSVNTNQFVHMMSSDMWSMLAGDPTLLASWGTAIGGLPPVAGELPWGYAAPLGAGRFFSQVQPFLPSLPPSVGPGGGSLIGMNLVIQVGILDTNGSTPAAAKFSLTNAIGIQAMAGPPLKLNAGPGGNWGPPLSRIDFKVQSPNSSMVVNVNLSDGTTATVPMSIINGTTAGFRLPRLAITQGLSVRSHLGVVPALRQPIAIVTHDEVQDIAIVGVPTFTTKTKEDGLRVFGASVIGNVSQIANTILTIPVPPDFATYDLEVKVYPLDRPRMYAGLGQNVPLNLAVAPVGALPALAPYALSTSFAPGAVVLEESYTNLSGPVDLTMVNTAFGGFDFLAVARAVEK